MPTSSSGLYKSAKLAFAVFVCYGVIYSLQTVYVMRKLQNCKDADTLQTEFILSHSTNENLGSNQVSLEPDFQSKAFSTTMGPSKVAGFHTKAQRHFNREEITLTTLLTRDRFHLLSRLATHYQGPISAAIHVNNDTTKDEVLQELHDMYAKNSDMGRYVDTHLIIDRYDRQFNMWRNVARLFSRTDYVMMLDIDFHLCTNFGRSIRDNPEIIGKLREGNAAVVLPAFEYTSEREGFDPQLHPTTKPALVELVTNGTISTFHRYWKRGHGSTNYKKWYNSTSLYKVDTYDIVYEPYIVYKKENAPWCDERFIGYGANKAACHFEIFISGFDYYVLPEDFVIHQTHAYPKKTRYDERTENRELYKNFREELCKRYRQSFIATGEWDSPRAKNHKSLCNILDNGETKAYTL